MTVAKKLSYLTCPLVLAIASTHAQAQQKTSEPAAQEESTVGDIIVTAQKRAQSVQKVPLSVSVFSGQALEARGLQSIGDLAAASPGLQFGRGIGIVTPFLRGVGNPATAVGQESSVAVYMDGVYYTRLPVGFFALSNIERVEVLKGPQGTLFGRNSTGGVIHLITKDPTYSPSIHGSLGYGNLATISGNLYVSMGINEKISADVSVAGQYQKDGYGRNIITGSRTGHEDYFTARSKVLANPSDLTTLTLAGYYSYSHVGIQGNTFPGTTQGYISQPSRLFTTLSDFYDQRSDSGNYSKANSIGASFKIEQQLPFGNFNVISAYSKEEEKNISDSDYLDRTDFYTYLLAHVKQFTQEVQLSSTKGSKVNWIAGIYYYNTISKYVRSEFRGIPLFGDGVDSFARQKALSYAAFAQVTFPISTNLNLTGGIRYTKDKISGSGSLNILTSPAATIALPDANDSTNKLTFKAALDYQFTPDVMAYVSFSRGYKTGTFNLLTYDPTPNRPELLDAYEVGMKGVFFDRTLRINIAGFYYDISDPQVQLFRNATIILSNAGKARVKGVEIEGQAELMDGLTTRFGATYLSATYRSYDNAPSGPILFAPPYGSISPLIQIDARGNRTPQASKLTFNVGADYLVHIAKHDLTFTVDYTYNDGYYFEPDNLLKQKSFGMLNGQIKFSPVERVSLKVWGKNLTKSRYATFATTQSGPSGFPFISGAPRTYGVAVDFEF